MSGTTSRLATGSSQERRALQQLARQQMIAKLLTDIAIDMTVCRLEGWDPHEFPRMILNQIRQWTEPNKEAK